MNQANAVDHGCEWGRVEHRLVRAFRIGGGIQREMDTARAALVVALPIISDDLGESVLQFTDEYHQLIHEDVLEDPTLLAKREERNFTKDSHSLAENETYDPSQEGPFAKVYKKLSEMFSQATLLDKRLENCGPKTREELSTSPLYASFGGPITEKFITKPVEGLFVEVLKAFMNCITNLDGSGCGGRKNETNLATA